MKHKLTITVASLASILVATVLVVTPSYAFTGSIQDGANAAKGQDQVTNLFGATGTFATITNILLFIVGAISVIMIIIGGLRYVTSGGNSANITAAKNTILYAIVGIVVALLAYAVINFVIGSFTGGGAGGGTNV